MEFLKELFGDKAFTYEQLQEALKDNKDVKIGNLAGGAYVGKEKYDALKIELDTAKNQLSEANKTIQSFKDMDIDSIKKEAETYKTKLEETERKAKEDMEKFMFDNALQSALTNAKAKNVKAVKALLDMDGLKFNNGEVVGLSEQIEKLKTENDYMFESDEKKPQFVSSSGGGKSAVSSDDIARQVMGLPINK